jgi:hypothetical protein
MNCSKIPRLVLAESEDTLLSNFRLAPFSSNREVCASTRDFSPYLESGWQNYLWPVKSSMAYVLHKVLWHQLDPSYQGIIHAYWTRLMASVEWIAYVCGNLMSLGQSRNLIHGGPRC